MKRSMTVLFNNPGVLNDLIIIIYYYYHIIFYCIEAWLDMACVELKDSAALRGYLKEQKKYCMVSRNSV